MLAHRLLRLILPLAILLPHTPASAEAAWPLVQRPDVLDSLRENKTAWDTKINGAHPRLFFDAAGLRRLRSAFPANRYHDLVTGKLAAILSKPIPPYVTPAEDAKLGNLGDVSQLWERAVGDEIVLLAYASLVDDSPALRQRLKDEVIQVCNYPTWGNDPGYPNGDLACAHMARAVAIAWDWHPDLWQPGDRNLIIDAVRQRAGALLAGLYGKTYWDNRYVENHNHISASALGLCGLAFFDDIPDAPEWLAAARLDFQNVMHYSAPDGSSPEGLSYWTYSLCFILQYIEGTRGIIDSADLYNAPFLRHGIQFRLYSSTPDLHGTLPWGDSVAKDYEGPRFYLHRLAAQYGDGAGEWLAENIPFGEQGAADVAVWCALWGNTGVPPVKPRETDFHFPVSDIVTTRSGWGAGAYMLTMKSGFNNRNHAHLDAGAIALCFNSDWLLTAPRYGNNGYRVPPAYWRSEGPRWQFFCTSTESHSALLINGTNERFDPQARGTIDQYLSSPSWCWASEDLTQAYHGVTAVRRGILHARNDYILVMDSISAPAPVTVDWLAQMAPGCISQSGDNALLATLGSGQLRVEMLSPPEPFASRKPASRFVDKPAKLIDTFTVAQNSAAAAYLALLQPGPANAPLSPLTHEIAGQTAGMLHLVIHGQPWTDDLFWSKDQSPIDINLTTVKGAAKANMMTFRTHVRVFEGFCASGLRDLQLPEFHLTPPQPCEIAAEKNADGSWSLTADRDVQGSIVCPEGFSVRPQPAAEGAPCRLLISRTRLSATQ
jgi:hypothetical protein